VFWGESGVNVWHLWNLGEPSSAGVAERSGARTPYAHLSVTINPSV